MKVLLTFEKMVHLGQSDVMMVDVTVFEQAPELQAGQQVDVIFRLDTTKSAVETIDRPQLFVIPQHHKLHLLLMKHRIGTGTGVKIKM